MRTLKTALKIAIHNCTTKGVEDIFNSQSDRGFSAVDMLMSDTPETWKEKCCEKIFQENLNHREEIQRLINRYGENYPIPKNDDEIDTTGHPEDFKGCGYWV